MTATSTTVAALAGTGAMRYAPTSMTLLDAAEALAADGIGLLVVERAGHGMVGVVSERDIVHAVADGADLEAERLDSVMADGVVTVSHDADLARATELMVEADVRHLVVVDDEGEVTGLVSSRDVMRAWHDG